MSCHPEWGTRNDSKGDIVSGKGFFCARVEVGIGMNEKSGGVDGELVSEP